MEDVHKRKIYRGLSSPRVSVTYGGNQTLQELMKGLIMLDIEDKNSYNEGTNMMFKGGQINAEDKQRG